MGEFAPLPEIWAYWFDAQDFDEFTSSEGFPETAIEDTENWRTEDTVFSTTWSVNRWLPKEERSVEYYTNEYRFKAGDVVQVYTLTWTLNSLY